MDITRAAEGLADTLQCVTTPRKACRCYLQMATADGSQLEEHECFPDNAVSCAHTSYCEDPLFG